MHLISRRILRECWEKAAETEMPLKYWAKKVEAAEWQNAQDVREAFPSVDVVGNDRYVFNILNNRYRVVAKIEFTKHLVFVRFVGTHRDYDAIKQIDRI